METPLICLILVLELYQSLILSFLFNFSHPICVSSFFCLLICLDLVHTLTLLCSANKITICLVFLILLVSMYFQSSLLFSIPCCYYNYGELVNSYNFHPWISSIVDYLVPVLLSSLLFVFLLVQFLSLHRFRSFLDVVMQRQ